MNGFVLMADRLVDLGGSTPALWRYVFVRATEVDAVLCGYFVDLLGGQVGAAWSATIGAEPATLAWLYGAALPEPSVGFIGRLTQDVTFGLGGCIDGTIAADMVPDSNYPVLCAADFVILGRVG